MFVAYGDVAAARDALGWATRMLAQSHRSFQLEPMLWRFDQLVQPQWRDLALRDAARAHARVVALREPPQADSALDVWLQALASRQAGAPVTSVVLLRDEVWTLSLERVSEDEAAAAPCRTSAPASAAQAA